MPRATLADLIKMQQDAIADRPAGVEVYVTPTERRVYRGNFYYLEQRPPLPAQLVIAHKGAAGKEDMQPLDRIPEWCVVGYLTEAEMAGEAVMPEPDPPLPKSAWNRDQLPVAPAQA